ncbi:MAG: cytosine permease [Chloroflexota bacterium]
MTLPLTPYTGQEYQVQPLVWQGLVAVMIDVVMLIALFSWAFSMAKKAWRGEEIETPYPPPRRT